MAGPSTSYYTGYEGRQQTLEVGVRPEEAPKPKKSRARWQRRIEGTEINNVIEIARKYDAYLAQPDVLGYRDVAEHFGVTKATVSYYLSLLRRLPQDFIEWLESCNDEQVVAFFSLKRLRPIARLGEDSAQRATLLNETEQLSTDLGERSDTVADLLRLLGKQDQPSLPRREHRVIQLD